MLFKSAFVASILAGYQASPNHFDYQVQCEFLVRGISYTNRYEKVWSSSKVSRSKLDSLEASMSAGGKYGLVKANVAAAMKTVNSARSETELSNHRETSFKQGFQPESNQVHRKCTHTINVGGQVITQTDTEYVFTERRDSAGNWNDMDYYTEQARDYINKNIVPGFAGLSPLPFGTTLLRINFNVDIPVQDGWDVSEWLKVEDGHWGELRPWQTCPKDHYAMSLRVQDEAFQGSGDDTYLNGLRMRCRHVKGKANGRSILGSVGASSYVTEFGHWGEWGLPKRCPEGAFVAALRTRLEANQHTGDDTALNGLGFLCRWSVVGEGYPEEFSHLHSHPLLKGLTRNDEHYVLADHGHGPWSDWTWCPMMSFMCGFQLRIEANQGPDEDEDDTAMNGISMKCCKMPYDVSYPAPPQQPDSSSASYKISNANKIGLTKVTENLHVEFSFTVGGDALGDAWRNIFQIGNNDHDRRPALFFTPGTLALHAAWNTNEDYSTQASLDTAPLEIGQTYQVAMSMIDNKFTICVAGVCKDTMFSGTNDQDEPIVAIWGSAPRDFQGPGVYSNPDSSKNFGRIANLKIKEQWFGKDLIEFMSPSN